MAGKWCCLPPRTPAPRDSCSGAQGSCHTCRTLMFLNFDLFISLARRHAKSLQLYLTLCDPVDCSPPSSSVHGIVQARRRVSCHALLQRIFLAQGSNLHLLCLLHWEMAFLPIAPPGKPVYESSVQLKRGKGLFCASYLSPLATTPSP